MKSALKSEARVLWCRCCVSIASVINWIHGGRNARSCMLVIFGIYFFATILSDALFIAWMK